MGRKKKKVRVNLKNHEIGVNFEKVENEKSKHILVGSFD